MTDSGAYSADMQGATNPGATNPGAHPGSGTGMLTPPSGASTIAGSCPTARSSLLKPPGMTPR